LPTILISFSILSKEFEMKNLSLNSKILSILSIFVASATLIATVGIIKMSAIDDSLNKMVMNTVPRVVVAKTMSQETSEMANLEKVFILDETKEGKAKLSESMDKLEVHVREEISDLLKKSKTEMGRQNMHDILSLMDQWHPINAQIRALALSGKNEEAIALARGSSREIMLKIDEVLNAFVLRNVGFMETDAQESAALYRSSRDFIIIMSVLSILSGIMLAFFVLRSVNRAIAQVIEGLNESSTQVTAAALEIAASSQELSQGATEQASSLEETSAAVEEMNSMVQRTADNAQQSNDTARGSGESASRGKRVVEDMKTAMVNIDQATAGLLNAVSQGSKGLEDVVKLITEISEKTKVINDIVFQTKLLSFNASVEAARAGEHGKGFAVVAEEVGNLAQMSGNAAKEISTMLESSVKRVQSIVAQTQNGVESLAADSKLKVAFGKKVALECGEVLDEIVSKVTIVSQMSHSISTASDEQARGISEITKAVTQLDQMTQQNAAVSEEAASAAEELSAQAESMQAIVRTLIRTIHGSHVGEQSRETVKARAPVTIATREPVRKSNVVPIGAKKSTQQARRNSVTSSLRAVSGDTRVPSEDDQRFRDI
jgi:methyl-accepting chemotaxis protein